MSMPMPNQFCLALNFWIWRLRETQKQIRLDARL